ncbi:hypothetical protein RvY_07476 [Ramazzottius varieornatus]|uniref:SEA domain-containing protein n=1 Tax=Ramazzottius varieornatus TaxID=947166 RepID=A0A1D1V2J2_RAMVA|nr:hypothetical protein RvY_07476 [Ramazzottius varieornatus]
MLPKLFSLIVSILLLSTQIRCQEEAPLDPDGTGPVDVPNTKTPEVDAVEPEVTPGPAADVVEAGAATAPLVEDQSTVDPLPTLQPVAPESAAIPTYAVVEEATVTTPAPAEVVEEASTVADVTEETVTGETTTVDTTAATVLATATLVPDTTTGIVIIAAPVAAVSPDAFPEDATDSSSSTTTGTSTTVAGFVPIIGVAPVLGKTDLAEEPETPVDVEEAVVDDTTTPVPILISAVPVAETTTKSSSPILFGSAGSGPETGAAGEAEPKWAPGPTWSSTPLPVIPITDRRLGFASRWEGFKSWINQWGLLLFGLLLLLLIILVMIYACCCMKKAAAPVEKERIDIERTERLRPVDLLRQSDKSYQEDLSSGTVVQSYRETTTTIRETGQGAPLGAGTPHNSFAQVPSTHSGGIENQNFRATPNSGTGYKFINPRHLDSGVIAHSPTPPPSYGDRRLDVPPNRLSSRDVIFASRAPTAVSAEAPSVPLHSGTLERDASLDRDRPVLRGGNPDRSSSPRPYSVHRTTLLITPSVNRDPDQPFNPAEQNSGLTYSDYVGMIRGEPSDFGQYSPDRRPLPAYSSSGRLLRENNTESQV